jgi:hypothetical protein
MIAIDFSDLALIFVAGYSSFYAVRTARAFLSTRNVEVSIELISADSDTEAVPDEIKQRLQPLRTTLEEAGYVFHGYIRHNFAQAKTSVIEAAYRNADGTISAGVFDRIGWFPPVIELDTLFEDGTLMIVSAPYGEKIDVPGFHSRHAYDPDVALAYQEAHMPVMSQQHGPPQVIVAESSVQNPAAKIFRSKFSKVYHARRNQFLGTGAAMFLIHALLAWALVVLMVGQENFEAKFAVYAVMFIGLIAIMIGYRVMWFRFARFPGALDEGINPPPIIGTAGRKKKKA